MITTAKSGTYIDKLAEETRSAFSRYGYDPRFWSIWHMLAAIVTCKNCKHCREPGNELADMKCDRSGDNYGGWTVCYDEFTPIPTQGNDYQLYQLFEKTILKH